MSQYMIHYIYRLINVSINLSKISIIGLSIIYKKLKHCFYKKIVNVKKIFIII